MENIVPSVIGMITGQFHCFKTDRPKRTKWPNISFSK